MNFNSVFEELNKLYEEAPKAEEVKVEEVGKAEEAGEAVEEACAKKLEEAADEEVEIVEEESAEEVSEESDEEIEFAEEPVEPIARQLILECSKCGAIVIKDEADVAVDEESDLVNIEDECQYCEETEGYKIIGVVAPYEVSVEEEAAEIEEVEETDEVTETEEPAEEATVEEEE